MTKRRILALGGGGFSEHGAGDLLDRYLLDLLDTDRPKVCFVPTASGDSEGYILRFFEAFAAAGATPSVLRLFRRTDTDLRAKVLAQDAVIVGGGNTVNMLAIWREHGLDTVLREAWERGVVLSGLSAGSLCWYEAGVTDSLGLDLSPFSNGLGFLANSHCPHYTGEPNRRPRYRELVGQGSLPAGVALEDDVAALYEGTELTELVTSREGGRAWLVEAQAAGVVEQPLEVRLLA